MPSARFHGPQVTSDDIRAYVAKRYLEPARQAGRRTFTVRMGDLMEAMPGLTGVNHPCSALRAKSKFQRPYGATLVREDGPRVGFNTELTFSIEAEARVAGEVGPGRAALAPAPSAAARLLSLYGVGTDAYAKHGGGDEVLARVREGWE